MEIKIEKLTKKFQKHVVFEDMNLHLNKATIVGVLGCNGTGKTTLFKMLAGLQHKYEGQILLNGQKPGVELADSISYLPDHDFFESARTVGYYVDLFAKLFPHFNKEKAVGLVGRFALDLKAKILHLSKGDREKLALALALSREAKLYLLDEPLSAVDTVAREKILQLLLEYYEADTMVLISTHLIQDLEQILDYVVFLGNRGVLLADEAEELRMKYQKSLVSIFKEVYGQ